MDLNTYHDWPVKNGIIILPIRLKGHSKCNSACQFVEPLRTDTSILWTVSNVPTKLSYIFFPSFFFKNTSSSGLFLCKLKFILLLSCLLTLLGIYSIQQYHIHCISLQCRCILGGRKLLVYVCTVVTAIFVTTEEG